MEEHLGFGAGVPPLAGDGEGLLAPLPGIQQVALSSEGDGWALDGAGRVARVLEGNARKSTEPNGAVFRNP